MISYLKKQFCRHHEGIASVHRLKDASLGVGNERYLWAGICKKCGAVVDLECWPIPGLVVYELVQAACVVLLIVALAAVSLWLCPMLK